MKTLFDEEPRRLILERLRRLQPGTPPHWGRMTVDGMLGHLVESMRMATGELVIPSRKLPMRHPPLRQLIVYWLPWPKGAPTAPELLPREEGSVEARRNELAALIERFAALQQERSWPEHPAFGKLGRRGWGVLTLRHADHHLRQFGV